jgi:3'-phosphoadenosine 5'-phosphosulfate sulfotransferase (PAPS reductase)/FAD synthetase
MMKKDLNNYLELIGSSNINVFDMFCKANSVINNEKYKNVMVSVSGGSDSDILIDLCTKVSNEPQNINYVWFDTGIEYQATKNHLCFLEDRYNIKIDRVKAITPVPLGVKNYGLPFKSKKISDYIARLVKHGFQFDDLSFQELYSKYPRCKSALRWWCNEYDCHMLNIDYTRGLKEFLIENPPTFLISDKCCKGAKKDVSKVYIKNNNIDLSITGVRRAEGGVRSVSYKSCFDTGNGLDSYRPIFWLTDTDKQFYKDTFNVVHSDCYTKYGLKRTGCCGCPYGKNFEKELKIIQRYEPNLYRAVNNIFGQSYEYTRKFLEYRKRK